MYAQLQTLPDPEQRTLFIDIFPHWESDLDEVISAVQGTASSSLRSGVCLGVGSISSDLVSDSNEESWKKLASQWFTEKPDSSKHSAAGWLLRQWKLPIPEIPNANAIVPQRDWFVDHAFNIVDRLKALGYSKMDQLLQDPDFAILHGDPQFVAKLQNWKTLDEYWVANCEVTRGQFEKFVKDDKVAVSEKREKWEDNGSAAVRRRVSRGGPSAN